LKHHIINRLLTQWMYLHFLKITKANIESSINWWFYKDLQLPSHLLQVHQTYQVLPINGHFSKLTTIFICSTPLLHKHHKIVLYVLIFEPCNYTLCDLFFNILHNIISMYLTTIPSVSTYFLIRVVFYSRSF
jgi:hypothetical protein